MSDLETALRDAFSRRYDVYDDISERDNLVDAKINLLSPTGKENVAMLQQVYLFTVLENEKFDMGTWAENLSALEESAEGLNQAIASKGKVVCGTTMCLAGTAAWMAFKDNECFGPEGDIHTLIKVGDVEYAGKYVASAEHRGADVLGLNWEQADTLFYLPNDLDVVQAALNYIAQRDLSVKENVNV